MDPLPQEGLEAAPHREVSEVDAADQAIPAFPADDLTGAETPTSFTPPAEANPVDAWEQTLTVEHSDDEGYQWEERP